MGVLMSEKVALQHNVDYATCLGMVKEARGKGLTAPVILMGKAHSPLANIRPYMCLILSFRILQPFTCIWGTEGDPGCI